MGIFLPMGGVLGGRNIMRPKGRVPSIETLFYLEVALIGGQQRRLEGGSFVHSMIDYRQTFYT
jgi:hypothetical protein